MLIGGIEAGGTKMVCAVADENGSIKDRITIPTTQPAETMETMMSYFKKKDIAALGIGSFGPLDLNPTSATYGYITQTPKPGWQNTNFAGMFSETLGIPVAIDTDVNAAILGEVTWGAAKNCDTAIYITIGTGIGVGVYCNGTLLHGMTHPEAGHILMRRHPSDTFKGNCPYHFDCFEGLASGPALEVRYGTKAAALADDENVWKLEAYYIAQAITNYILTYSPQKIILWGGVMHQPQLYPLVRQNVHEMLNGYIYHSNIENLDEYIIPPALGENPGILGAIKLGLQALEK